MIRGLTLKRIACLRQVATTQSQLVWDVLEGLALYLLANVQLDLHLNLAQHSMLQAVVFHQVTSTQISRHYFRLVSFHRIFESGYW